MSSDDPWSFSLRNSFSWDEDSPQGSPSPLQPSSQKSEDDARAPPQNPFSIAKVNAAIRDANQPSRTSESKRSTKPSILPQKGVLALVRKQAGAQNARGARGFRPSSNPARKASLTKENAPEDASVGDRREKHAHVSSNVPSAPADAHTVVSPRKEVPSRHIPTSGPSAIPQPSQPVSDTLVKMKSQILMPRESSASSAGSRSRVDAVFSSPARTGTRLSNLLSHTAPVAALLSRQNAPESVRPILDTGNLKSVVASAPAGAASSESSLHNSTGPDSIVGSAMKPQTFGVAPKHVHPGRFVSPLTTRQIGAPFPASSVRPTDANMDEQEPGSSLLPPYMSAHSLEHHADQYSGNVYNPNNTHWGYSSPAGANSAAPGIDFRSGSEALAQTLSPRRSSGNSSPPPRKRHKPDPLMRECDDGDATYDAADIQPHFTFEYTVGHRGLNSANAHESSHSDLATTMYDSDFNSNDTYDSGSATGFGLNTEAYAEDTQLEPGKPHALDTNSETNVHENYCPIDARSRPDEDEHDYTYASGNAPLDDAHDTSSDLSMSSLHAVPLPEMDGLGSVEVFSYGLGEPEGVYAHFGSERTHETSDQALDGPVYGEDAELAGRFTHSYPAVEQQDSPSPPPRCALKRKRPLPSSSSPSPAPKRRVPSPKAKVVKPLSAYAHPAFASDPDAGWSTLPSRGGNKSKAKGGKFTIPLGRLLGGTAASAGKERAREVEAWKKGKEDAKMREKEKNMEREVTGARKVTVYRPPPRK
ncbi:hypothetical protein PENSPDRAFT_757879 [Peniophora sp. CONT]|nr:hypothetical protein PENSPDRAFT_757879 [Peniophora sp. CONT]